MLSAAAPPLLPLHRRQAPPPAQAPISSPAVRLEIKPLRGAQMAVDLGIPRRPRPNSGRPGLRPRPRQRTVLPSAPSRKPSEPPGAGRLVPARMGSGLSSQCQGPSLRHDTMGVTMRRIDGQMTCTMPRFTSTRRCRCPSPTCSSRARASTSCRRA